MPLRNWVDIRFRPTDGSGDYDTNVEVTGTEGLPVSVISGAGAPTQDFLTGQNTLSTAATRIQPVRQTRTRVVIRNTHATITIYFGTGSGVSSTTGMPLLAGESFSILSVAELWAVAASGAPVLAWYEEYN